MVPGQGVVSAAGEADRRSDPTTCRACAGALGNGNVRINGRAVCAGCHRRMLGSGVQAILAGLLAGGAAAGLYYGILALFEVRFLLIGLLAGVMVGSAVRRFRGIQPSVVYRLYALGLTYLAVVSTYAHVMLELPSMTDPWQAWLATWTLPVRMAAEGKNLVTLVLLLLGLYEAWRFSAPPRAHVQGPFAADGTPLTPDV